MNDQPRILVWHAQANAYREALRRRLPDAPIDAISAAQHETGVAPETGATMDAAEVLLAWKVPPEALASMPSLSWVQVTGAGVDHFLDSPQLDAAIIVTRSLGRFGIQVAEYVVGYALNHLIGIGDYRDAQRRHEWSRGERPLLADRTVGIVGLGSLGLPTARALAALGARVLGVRHSGLSIEGIDDVFSAANWRDMLPSCDILVLAAPKTPETAGMIDADALAALPEGAVLINVSRGDLVNESALLAALDADHLGAAVLDVFATEPLPADHQLWDQPRAWITPHIAAPSEVEVIADEFAENYRRFIAGRELTNVVDRARGY